MELVLPQFGLFFWTLVLFLIIFFTLKKFAWKPILNSIKEREDTIVNALKSAETARAEMANLKSENEKLLQEARIERDKLLKEARSMKEQIITVGKEQAAIEAAKILETAKRQIESERRATLVELKNQVGQLSVDLAEKILKRKLEDEAQQLSFANDQIKDFNLN
jgi:F-type H+-transporting ATPase subunit b